MANTDDFTKLLAADLGIKDSPWLHNFVNLWASMENTRAANNPLATTMPGNGATDFNTTGVKNYPDLATGADATARTLQQQNFAPILGFLTKQNSQAGGFYWNEQHILPENWQQILDNFNLWGTTNLTKMLHDAPSQSAEIVGGGNVKPVGIVGTAIIGATIPGRVIGGAAADAVSRISSMSDAVVAIAKFVVDPKHWLRLFFVIGGLAIAAVGLFVYVKEKPPTFGAAGKLSSTAEALT